MRSPGSAVLPVLPPVTLLLGNSEAVTTVATTTDPAAEAVVVVTTVLLPLGLLLSRVGVAIMAAMELRPDMLHLAPLPVLPLVLLLGSNRHHLVAKLLTDMEDTEVTLILLAWPLRPLRACLRWLMAVLVALLPRLLLATSLLPLPLAINLLLPLPAISLLLPRLRREYSQSCHFFPCREKLWRTVSLLSDAREQLPRFLSISVT